nr:unnamed protein product [Callosobruchus chinensis]
MDMATDQEIVSDNEEKDDVQESTEHTDVFDQLLPSSSGALGHSTSETQELPEDIQERIRQNKERAERLRLERLQRARDQAAISLPGSSRLGVSQNSQNGHVNEDLFSNPTEKQKEEGTIEDLLDEINNKKISNEKLEKKKSSVIYSDEEIGETDGNEVIEKNKTPSRNGKASTKLLHSQSSEDETSEPEKGQKRTIEGLADEPKDQEFEVTTKKKRIKLIDSDSDDEDVNIAEEEHISPNKRGKVIDSDDEHQTEGTIDELLNEINTRESLNNEENGRNVESNEDTDGDSRSINKQIYRKKLRTIESDEEESEDLPNNKESNRHTKRISDSEESDENNINKENVNKRTQDSDSKLLQISESITEHTQDAKLNSQSMSLDEDRKK